MLYYWPIFESETFIGQRTGEERGVGNGVAIRPPLETLINHFRSSGGLTGFYTDWKSGTLAKDAAKLWKSARAKFQNTIWSRDREITIANFPEFGPGETGTEAVKRITQDADDWIFESDNPDYAPIRVSKNEIAHPILGTLVEVFSRLVR